MGFPVKLSVEMRSNRRETLDTTGLVHTDSGKEYSCAENMRRRDTVRNYVLFSDNRRLVMKNGKLKLNRKVCARTEELCWFVDCFLRYDCQFVLWFVTYLWFFRLILFILTLIFCSKFSC